MKLYNDVIQRGRTDPITEKDMTSDDLSSFKSMINSKIKETGQSNGSIQYNDYKGVWTKQNILGRFNFSKDEEGNTIIKDKYDFNSIKDTGGDSSQVAQALAFLFHPQSLGVSIGRKRMPEGKGLDVNINLGKLD